jgi:glyoxylase I family protein
MDFDFDHVHLVTQDVDAMVDYFERVFGAKRVSFNPDFKGAPSAVVGLGGMRVLVRGLRPGEAPDAVAPARVQGLDHFGVVVEDVEKAAEWLKARGAEFSVEPTPAGMNGRMIAFVRGPENIEIEIVAPFVGA